MSELSWYGCYSESWGKEIVPEAFSHPAKFSRGLLRRIYTYAPEQGYLEEGAMVIDPFGGVALGALDAMFHGLHHIGVELEDKFVQLGQQNIDLWNRRYGGGKLRRWGTATILQGDSRRLCEVLEGARAEGIVASPPYAESLNSPSSGIDFNKVSCESKGKGTMRAGRGQGGDRRENYGTSPAQLGNMPTGEPPQAVISSPPYGDITNIGERRDPNKSIEAEKRYRANHPELEGIRPKALEPYGDSPGQLGAMKMGEPPAGIVQVDACVSSPPWESCEPTRDDSFRYEGKPLGSTGDHYGNHPGQIGNITGDTFWSAAKIIMEQCHAVLAPGGVAIWVLKAFVRNKKIVDFPGQWEALCNSCGFETIEVIRAWLVEERGTQYDLTGEAHTKAVERKSFFRRLYEYKARAAKLWLSVPRPEQAFYLWQAHSRLWQEYNEGMGSPEPSNIRPTHARITSAAQGMAYRAAGEPDIETDTQIDWEIVLITRKGPA